MIAFAIRRVATILVFLAVFAVDLMAVGGDASSEKTIPLPQKNYAVTITDGQHVKTSASRVSWDGKIYIQGHRGDALTTIPFEKLSRIEIKPGKTTEPGTMSSMITLQSGETIELQIKSNSKCFGETSYGQFEIYLRDIRMIQFD